MDHRLIAMIFGLIGTSFLHISKGMQRHGIEALNKSRMDILSPKHRSRKKIIYICGVILNNSYGIWMIAGVRFASPVYFTSMFGFGLISLVLYSRIFLHEPISSIQLKWLAVVFSGTIIISIAGLFPQHSGNGLHSGNIQGQRGELTLIPLLWGTGIYAVFSILLLAGGKIFFPKRRNGIILGIIAGGIASLEPFYKSIGQSIGGDVMAFTPHSGLGWVFFLGSFGFGIISFLITQWGFHHRVNATILVAGQNGMFLALPFFLEMIMIPGYQPSLPAGMGLFLVIAGMARLLKYSGNSPDPEKNRQKMNDTMTDDNIMANGEVKDNHD